MTFFFKVMFYKLRIIFIELHRKLFFLLANKLSSFEMVKCNCYGAFWKVSPSQLSLILVVNEIYIIISVCAKTFQFPCGTILDDAKLSRNYRP